MKLNHKRKCVECGATESKWWSIAGENKFRCKDCYHKNYRDRKVEERKKERVYDMWGIF